MKNEQAKCPDCGKVLQNDSSTVDENDITHYRYKCFNGHVWERLIRHFKPVDLELDKE